MTPWTNRVRWTVAALLFATIAVAQPGDAWSGYGSRESEAKSTLAKAKLTDKERDVLEDALDDYFDDRERCLEALVDLLEPTDEDEQAEQFTARANMCAGSGAKTMREALDDLGDEPSIAALGFVNVFGSQEAAFMGALAAMTVGEGRDRIVAVRVHLEEMTDRLDKKWKAIQIQDKSLDERAKQVSAEIRKDYNAMVQRVADSNQDAAEILAEIVKKFAESDAPLPPTGSVIVDGLDKLRGVIGVAISWWQARNTRSAARARRYRNAFRSELRVLVVFNDVREDVEEFLENNDYPLAEKAFDAARKSAGDFVGKAKTSGQKSDAAEFRDDVMEVLAEHLEKTADVYGVFVDHHKEKFFGALSPSIKEELLETKSWREFHRWISGYRLDAKLNRWRKKASNTFEVDLSSLPPEARKELERGLRAVVEDLVRQMDAAEKNYEDLEEVVGGEREDVEDELD
jgi:hypothetical protein